MSQWEKWEQNLKDVGGWDNDMVAVNSGVVREIIELGKKQKAALKEAVPVLRQVMYRSPEDMSENATAALLLIEPMLNATE